MGKRGRKRVEEEGGCGSRREVDGRGRERGMGGRLGRRSGGG